MTETKTWGKPSREERKESLRAQATRSKEAWDKLSTMQKIEALDKVLGPNVGAKKQRAKLKALLEKEHAAAKAPKIEKPKEEAKPKEAKTKERKPREKRS